MLRGALVTLVFAGCTYRPGSFSYPTNSFPGTRTSVGCLDLAIQRRADYDGSAVLDYSFGNRCEKKTIVDLAYAKVIGRDFDGHEYNLRPFDPGNQILALPLDAGMAGHEALAYSAEHKLAQVCVDVASIVHREPESWLCFARKDDPVPPPPPEDTRPPGEQMEQGDEQRERSQQSAESNRTPIEDDSRAEVP